MPRFMTSMKLGSLHGFNDAKHTMYYVTKCCLEIRFPREHKIHVTKLGPVSGPNTIIYLLLNILELMGVTLKWNCGMAVKTLNPKTRVHLRVQVGYRVRVRVQVGYRVRVRY